MLKYIIKRLLMLILILFGVTVIVFTLKMITPGDPVESILDQNATEEMREAKREELGLNDPIIVQFWDYVTGIVTRGDFGTSYKTGQPVMQEILPRLRVTLIFCVGSVLIGLTVGLLLGILSAVKRYTWIDSLVLAVSMIFSSVPNFCVALLGIYLFSVVLGWLPSNGIETYSSYILPMVVNSLGAMSSYTRVTRSSMLEVLNQDYIRTARAKGQKENIIIFSHALRNSLIPVAAAVGNQFGISIGGSLIIETVFGIPGIEKYCSDAILARNYPAVLGGVIIMAFICSIINLITDLSYIVIDPRLKNSIIAESSTKKSSRFLKMRRAANG